MTRSETDLVDRLLRAERHYWRRVVASERDRLRERDPVFVSGDLRLVEVFPRDRRAALALVRLGLAEWAWASNRDVDRAWLRLAAGAADMTQPQHYD